MDLNPGFPIAATHCRTALDLQTHVIAFTPPGPLSLVMLCPGSHAPLERRTQLPENHLASILDLFTYMVSLMLTQWISIPFTAFLISVFRSHVYCISTASFQTYYNLYSTGGARLIQWVICAS
jgi:hypothetical protein